jgi:hypothetical protein
LLSGLLCEASPKAQEKTVVRKSTSVKKPNLPSFGVS